MADDPMQEAKRIMGALGRMPPKPHAEMKLGKRKKVTRRATVKRGSEKRSPLFLANRPATADTADSENAGLPSDV